MAVKVEVLDRWDRVNSLAPTWEALLEASGAAGVAAACVFLTFSYVATWWRIFGNGHDLRVLVARDATDRVIGIAPMMIRRGRRLIGRRLRYLTFIGYGREPRSEYMDYIVAPDCSEIASRALTDAIFAMGRGDWHFVRLPMIDQQSLVARALEQRVGSASKLRIVERDVAPYVLLRGSWEEVLAERPQKLRTNIRSSIRKANASPGFTVLKAPADISIEQAVETFLALHGERWKELGRTLVDDRARRFFHEVAEALAAEDRLLLSIILIDGEPAAASFDFLYRQRVFGYQSGWNPKYAKAGLGSVMRATTIQWAIDKGAREFDMLAGEEAYKLAWMSDARQLIELEVASPRTLMPRLVTSLRELRTLARSAVDLIQVPAGGKPQANTSQPSA